MEVFKGNLLKLGKVCSNEEKSSFIQLCQDFNDIFAWEYSDLKGFDPQLSQHTIKLEPNPKPVRQKQRPLNPKLEPLMVKDLNKLIESGIVFPIKHTSWVSNLVSIRKKGGEIRIFVDFRDLNQASLKDHYLLPCMEQILQVVLGLARYCWMVIRDTIRFW